MNVLVTGSTREAGAMVCEALVARGHRVRGLECVYLGADHRVERVEYVEGAIL